MPLVATTCTCYNGLHVLQIWAIIRPTNLSYNSKRALSWLPNPYHRHARPARTMLEQRRKRSSSKGVEAQRPQTTECVTLAKLSFCLVLVAKVTRIAHARCPVQNSAWAGQLKSDKSTQVPNQHHRGMIQTARAASQSHGPAVADPQHTRGIDHQLKADIEGPHHTC